MAKMRTPQATTVFAKAGIFMNKERPLTELEERFLRSVYDCFYLTVPQIAALHYERVTRSILNYVAAILKNLDDEHENYLQRGALDRAVRVGRNPSVFRLALKGIHHMASLGLSPLPRIKTSEFPDYEHLAHILEVNEFIIAARRFAWYLPSYELVEVRHNWMFQSAPINVPGEKKGDKKFAVVPDIWLDFRFFSLEDGLIRFPVHLELDRGKDTVFSFKAKLLTLLHYIDGPYEQYFHTPLVTLAFTTTKGEGRLHKMLEWTEELLIDLQRQKAAPFLFFAALPQRSFEPQVLFLDPIWRIPFDPRLKVLLGGKP